MVDPESLDGELALAFHRIVMKRFVFLVICIAVGASLSGCVSSREAFFNDMWNGSGESGESGGGYGTESPSDRFDNGGTSGGATGDYEGP
jgi:hypothetical protein